MIYLIILQKIRKKSEQGFTLLELIVVMLIATILGVIAYPQMMNSIGRAREVEAIQILSSLGQGQQTFFFEHGRFAQDLDQLDIGFSGKYYDFEQPTLISSANSTGVKLGAIGINANQTNTREYELGVYYYQGSFNLILCKSLNPNQMAEVPQSPHGDCIQGTKIE